MPGESPLSMMRPAAPSLRSKPDARQAPRRRRWRILTPVAILIALTGVWVWLWYYAASIADRTLAGWVEREAAAGRLYACGTETIGGFPLGIRADCAALAAEIKDSQPPYAVKAKAVAVTAQVYQPTLLTGDIVGPLTLAELGRPPSFSADWTRARVSVRGVPPDPQSVSVELVGPHLDRVGGAVGNGGATIVQAKRADLQGRVVAGSARNHPVVEVTFHLAAALAPGLHPLLAAPVDVEFDGVLRGFKDLSPKPWSERFREMQAGGGDITVKSLRIGQGGSIIVGAGTLKINQQGRLDGLARVAVVGIEQLAPLLDFDRMLGQSLDRLSGTDGAEQGVSALDRLVPGLSTALRESLIENLKKMGQPATVEQRPAIVLPLRFADGAVYLGMLRLGEVPPLF